MINESTPAQRAALAAELGITPESDTYSHLFKPKFSRKPGLTPFARVPGLAAPTYDGLKFLGCCPFSPEAEASNVWYEPLWRFLAQNAYDPIRYANRASVWGVESIGYGVDALIDASIAAGVPEIVEIFKEADNA